MKTTYFIATFTALVLAACGSETDTDAGDITAPPVPEVESPTFGPVAELDGVAAASYSLEKTHTSLAWYVGHASGLSSYRGVFTDYDISLQFDPAEPQNATLEVVINPLGVDTNYPGDYAATHEGSEFTSWEDDISRNANWLNADAHPEITFVSTGITRTGDKTGLVEGDLTLLGVTQPVTLDVIFNSSGNAPWYGERDLIGFNASTTFNRSDFGMTAYIPNVGDEIEIKFSGELLQDE